MGAEDGAEGSELEPAGVELLVGGRGGVEGVGVFGVVVPAVGWPVAADVGGPVGIAGERGS